MNTAALENLGLNKSEIKTYFALLELETSTVGPIIRKAKIPDSKIYSTLEKLQEKGLVSFVIKNKVKHFQASDPKNLLAILKQKQTQLQDQETELTKTIIPEIERRRRDTEEKQEAIVYETMAGIKAAFNYLLDALNPGEEYQVLSFDKGLGMPTSANFFREHHKQRKNKKIKFRLIAHEKSKDKITSGHPFIVKNTRYTNQSFPVGNFIFKNHVMTFIWGEKPTAFILKSTDNYLSYKNFFEELWVQSHK